MDDRDVAPYVCPGCYAIGGEKCAPYCIDAEIEADHREAIETGNYDLPHDGDDDSCSCIECVSGREARANR